MSATMNKMGSYMVMAFFCALFIKAFGDSNLGTCWRSPVPRCFTPWRCRER